MKIRKSGDFAERQKSSIEAKQAMLAKFKSAQNLNDPRKLAEDTERATKKAERPQAAKADKAQAAEATASMDDAT